LTVPQQINLFNPAFLDKRGSLSLKAALMGWLAIALLSVAFAGYAGIRNRQLAQQEREVTAKVTAAQAEIQRLAGQVSGRKQNPQIAAEIVRLESEISGRDEVMAVLKGGALGDTKGFSEHLRAFARQSFEGVWLTGLHIAGSGQDVAVEGRALRAEQVPSYLRRLNSESIMQGHPFSELLMQAPPQDPRDKGGGRPPYIEFRLATKSETVAAKAATR
jgi:type IV pilus assembly PilN-like protein